ncbi:MAG TPA: ATP-binding protein, partial [bacterium]|nr:ATP-binding protein [bacterium]
TPAVRLAGFSGDDLLDIQVAVSEAVANAFKHAYGGKPGGRIEVDLAYDGRELTIRIHDSGREVTPGLTVPRTLPPPGEGGRGLYLIGRLMDEVEIRQPGRRGRGTLVTMKKRLKTASA